MDENETDHGDLEIEAPPGLMPNLAEWGIQEIERGVCEDTAENRRAIKANKAKFNTVFHADGTPSGYLQVISADMYAAAQAYSKSNLLTDREDFNSDYLNGLDLLLAYDAENLAPTWVLRATRNFVRQEEEKRRLGPDAALHQSRQIAYPSRCKIIKGDNTRCWGWSDGASDSLGMCRIHARQANRKKTVSGMSAIQAARNRLISAAIATVDDLEHLAQTAESESVRLGAMNSILDRAGLRGGFEIEEKVEVKLDDTAALLADRLAKLREGQVERAKLLKQVTASAEETVEAEVVDDE